MLRILENVLLFFLAGFAWYWHRSDTRNPLAIILLIALAAGGVFVLDWWAIATTALGAVFGGRVFVASTERNQRIETKTF